MVRVFGHGVMGCWFDFLFQPVLHDWCNKGCGMYYTVWGGACKDPLLLIGKSSPCSGGSGFPLLYEWSFTIWPMPYKHI